MSAIRGGARTPLAVAAVLGFALLGGGGCRGTGVPPDVVARIGDSTLLYNADFQDYLRENGVESGEVPDAVLATLFREFLDERLLTHWAEQQQWVAPGDSTRKVLEILLGRFGPIESTPAEVEAYYREHAADFVRADRVRVRQILASDRETAERARDALRAGERFETVVRRLTVGGDGGRGVMRGGDLGVLERDDLPPDFAQALFAMQPGETSDVLTAAQGYHVVQLLAIEPSARLSLEQAEPEIRRELARRAADQTLARLVADARGQYDVKVYERNLPFVLPP